MDGVQHKRRQRELINHLRFIFTITKVRDVVFMRNVCLRNQHRTWSHPVRDGAEKLNKAMRLFQMNAVCSRDFPHKADGIQADITSPFHKVMQQHIHHRNQHFRRGEIEIDLVFAEGGPEMADTAIMKRERCQKG